MQKFLITQTYKSLVFYNSYKKINLFLKSDALINDKCD